MAGFVLSFENLKTWCERQNFGYRAEPESGRLAVLYRLLDQDCPLLFIPHLDRGLLTLAMMMPFRVPEDRYEAVREGVNLLNDNSYMGAWVLNPDRGELYFRVTLPALDNEYTDQGLHLAARVVVSTAEAVAAGLGRIATASAEPKSILSCLP